MRGINVISVCTSGGVDGYRSVLLNLYGCKGGYADGCMEVKVDIWTDIWMYMWTYGWIYVCMCECMDVFMDV